MYLKTLFTAVAVLSLYTATFAQAPKNVRINGGIQYNFPELLFNTKIPTYNRQNEGFAVCIHPKLLLNKHISLGLNLEYALVTEKSMVINNQVMDVINTFNLLSLVPTANYYFTTNRVRPFAGLGLGLYHSLSHKPSVLFGGRAAAGVNVYDVFELSLEYNRIGTKIALNPQATNGFDNYYAGVKGSFSIGVCHWRKQSNISAQP